MVSREVVNLVCSRLRSLPYRYIYRIKAQGFLTCCSRKMAKRNYIADVIEKDEREKLQVGCCAEGLSMLLVTVL